MKDETIKLAEFLHDLGWRSPNDAQWARLDDAVPDIRAMLSAYASDANGTVTREQYVEFGKSKFLDGLQQAIVLCDELCWAIDAGGNQYRREAHAGRVLMKLREAYATASRGVAATSEQPATAGDSDGQECRCSDGPYHYSSCPHYTGADPFAALGRVMTK